MIAKFFLIIVLYRGAEIGGEQVFFAESEKECSDAKALVLAQEKVKANRSGFDLWAECFAITYTPPPKDKPNDKKSEVTS